MVHKPLWLEHLCRNYHITKCSIHCTYTAFEILLSYQSLYDTCQRNLYLVEQTPLSTPTNIVYIKQWYIRRLLISFFHHLLTVDLLFLYPKNTFITSIYLVHTHINYIFTQ